MQGNLSCKKLLLFVRISFSLFCFVMLYAHVYVVKVHCQCVFNVKFMTPGRIAAAMLGFLIN